ncbi:hypothetical protein BKA93DRAFT_821259 [Sparassis latifolia]
MTNNAFFYEVKDRYREFMTAHRQFAYLQALKRFGLQVTKKLKAGCLAVLCPACPQPDINMDPEWQDRLRSEWYKDAFQYAKDGNFNLNPHRKKMDFLDFALTDGAAYYAENAEYEAYLEEMKAYADFQEETSTCSEFKALAHQYAGKLKSGQIDYNIQKVFNMAHSLKKKFEKVLHFRDKNAAELEELKSTLHSNDMPLDEWKRHEKEFQDDVVSPHPRCKTMKSPYQPEEDTAPTTKDVLVALGAAEKQSGEKRKHGDSDGLEDGGARSMAANLGALLIIAIDLERQQKALKLAVEDN